MVKFIKCIYELHQMCSLHNATLKNLLLANKNHQYLLITMLFSFFFSFLSLYGHVYYI